MAWCVYLLRCGDGSLYAGATNDVARRLARHAAGKGGRYTRSHLPVALAYVERVRGRGAALRREAAIKRLSRAAKRALVAGASGDVTAAASPTRRPRTSPAARRRASRRS